MKKAQGLSLNTIIIAAIVLIVLIVLWAIFTGRMGGFSKGVQEKDKNCDQVKGTGDGLQDPPCPQGQTPTMTKDITGTQVCCVAP